MRHLYSALFYLLVPFAFLRLLYLSIREPGYRRALPERLGYFRSKAAGQALWIHAVSAGEMVAAAPLVRRLLDQGQDCLVTNMTPAGRERCQALLGSEVENCYAPYDLPGSVKRFLRRNRPCGLVIIDTELWPNTIHQCTRQGIKTMLINGRLSAKSAAGYQRLRWLSAPMMAALTTLAVQTQAQADRFVALGAARGRVDVTGSIKFDGELPAALPGKLAALRQRLGTKRVLLAASTHPGEELPLLAAFNHLCHEFNDLALIIAPRHVHRTPGLVKLIQAQGQEPLLFSQGGALGSRQVMLVDAMGELDACFALAEVAFIGGSLVDLGGHNLLEAVRADAAVVMGRHLRNIEDLAGQFIDAGGMLVVQDAQGLTEALSSLVGSEAQRAEMVARAKEVLAANQGALDRALALIERNLGPAGAQRG